MKLKQIASNMTEVEAGNVTVLFSYKTPVACHIQGQGYYRTSERYSVTTSKHINKWLAGASATEQPPAFFENLLIITSAF